MEVSSGISMNLMPLDCFCLVWCLMEWCICCWCSIRSKLVKWRACLLLLSNLASAIRLFRNASRSTSELFFVVFKVFVRVLIFLLIVIHTTHRFTLRIAIDTLLLIQHHTHLRSMYLPLFPIPFVSNHPL